MKQQLSIVKIGGNIIENKNELNTFLKLFASLMGPKILVHGGGKRATNLGEKLGVKTTMIKGRRVTTADSLELAMMVYAGLINKNIVALLQANNCNALGLSGADGNSILAIKRAIGEVDFGYVGDITLVNDMSILKLLTAGFTPVFCALSHDGNGQILNTNADTIASELAIGMSKNFETILYYCFEKKGVLKKIEDDDSVIEHINTDLYNDLLSANTISEGMLPKMENCFYALKNNVSKVCIGNLYMIEEKEQLFTTITL